MKPAPAQAWRRIVLDAALVVVVSTVVALTVNAARRSGAIPLVADKEYEILVPCPEHLGQPAAAIAPEAVQPEEKGLLVVDARDAEEHRSWHLPGATSIPYDYLEPDPREREILKSGARKVVVYGDGDSPDSGEQLATALSGKGLRNVYYVRGGAPALRRSRGEGSR